MWIIRKSKRNGIFVQEEAQPCEGLSGKRFVRQDVKKDAIFVNGYCSKMRVGWQSGDAIRHYGYLKIK
jgi:hypothetical protein